MKDRKTSSFCSLPFGASADAPARVLAGTSEQEIRNPAGFRIGACDWMLGEEGSPEVFGVAKKIGLEGVQVSMCPDRPDRDLRHPENRHALLDASRETGVRIASLALGNCLLATSYKRDPKAAEWVEDCVGVCEALGVKTVLLAFFRASELLWDPVGRKEVVRRLRTVAARAEKTGVVLGIESCLPARKLLQMLDEVNSPSVGVYYDLYNLFERGLHNPFGRRYDIYSEIRELGRHICEFHAKDHPKSLLGQGKVDFRKVREAMDAIGYRGWIHLEAGTPLGLEESYRKNAEFLRAIFPAQVEKGAT